MVVVAGLSYSGQWRGGCWRRGIPSSVVVALSGMPQLSLLSVIVGSSAYSTLVKVQPSFVSTVAVLDMLIGGGWFFGVFLVEFAYNLWGVFEVFGRVPDLVRVWETSPLDSILYVAPVLS